MKTLKKYAYQSPETEILPLEAGSIMEKISDPWNDPNETPDSVEWGAPWRF